MFVKIKKAQSPFPFVLGLASLLLLFLIILSHTNNHPHTPSSFLYLRAVQISSEVKKLLAFSNISITSDPSSNTLSYSLGLRSLSSASSLLDNFTLALGFSPLALYSEPSFFSSSSGLLLKSTEPGSTLLLFDTNATFSFSSLSNLSLFFNGSNSTPITITPPPSSEGDIAFSLSTLSTTDPFSHCHPSCFLQRNLSYSITFEADAIPILISISRNVVFVNSSIPFTLHVSARPQKIYPIYNITSYEANTPFGSFCPLTLSPPPSAESFGTMVVGGRRYLLALERESVSIDTNNNCIFTDDNDVFHARGNETILIHNSCLTVENINTTHVSFVHHPCVGGKYEDISIAMPLYLNNW